MQKMSFLIRTVTVGSGIHVIKDTSPDQPPKRVMDFTIGRDFHPATKTFIFSFTLNRDCSNIIC